MAKFLYLFIFIPTLVTVAGCGGSASVAPVAEQSEIEKYVAEHPESATPNYGGIK